jgi:anti-sigma regulatory factor (Ser/Thr protein kinase)
MTVTAGATTAPAAEVPDLGEPVRDEFSVRVSRGAADALASDPAAQWVGRLRRISAAKLRARGLGALLDDAKLLVSELVTNALRYGQGGEIEFRLVITRHGLLLAVDDGSEKRPRLSDVATDSETGRGLFLVDALADRWGVSADGTTTWCTLTLPEDTTC